MSTKSSELFAHLPSASELLEKPPIRALAARWNRSIVAAGVRSFLEELRHDLERRTADIHLPSLHELAERAARYVASLQQPAARPVINATGRFFDPTWSGAPLADEALERIVACERSYLVDGPRVALEAAAATLCRLTGAEAATVVTNYSGAVYLALAAVAVQKNEVVIARREVGEVEMGSPLEALAATAGVVLREVGAVNHTATADYEAGISDRVAAIVRHTPDHYCVAGTTASVELEALVGLARDRGLRLVDLAGAAPLVSGLPALDKSLPSAAASIDRGACVVALRGDGLIGGPACGVLLGAREMIDRVESQPLFAAWRATPATCAALDATLALFDNLSRLQVSVPLFQMLSASVENLRQRAERLAPQMSQAADVDTAVAVPSMSRLGLAFADEPRPSYAIALEPVGGDVRALDARLRAATVPVVGRVEEGRLLVDLRTILPRQDQRLVESTIGATNTAEKRAPNDTSVDAG